MKEKTIERIEELNWSVREYEDNYMFETWSPAGENIVFEVPKKNFVQEVRQYATGFDVDEHVELWIENRGKNGVPSTARELIEDAEAICDMLHQLATEIEVSERDKITVLRIEPRKAPSVAVVENNLKSFQKEVGGYIEEIAPFPDPVAIICNEEGKIDGLPLNRAIKNEDGDIVDVIAGTFLVVGCNPDESNFASLSDELIEKYRKVFSSTLKYTEINGNIYILEV